MLPKIALGCPIKNREWILPEYLKALFDIEYPNKEYIFLENNSIDNSFNILQEFANHNNCRVKRICTEEDISEDRQQYGINKYAHLADIRNQFLELFLKTDAEYLFSCDSDIIVPPAILWELLHWVGRKTIIGTAISNVANKELDGEIPGNFMELTPDGLMKHIINYPDKGIINVDVIGACYLIPRQAIKDCIRYAPDSQGEDIPFCKSAKEKGYTLLVDFNIKPQHRMTKI